MFKSEQLMVLDTNVNYYTKKLSLISLDVFNKKPYTKILYTSNNSAPKIGSIIKLGDNYEPKEELQYHDHSFEYAVVLAVKDLKLLVYGNKIGEKIIEDNLTINTNPTSPSIYEFKRGDKLLLEINKKIRIVHNITVAKLKFEMQHTGPKIK